MMSGVRLGFPAALLGLLLATCLLAPPARATAQASAPPSRTSTTLRLESDTMAQVNRVRARAGCPALRVDSALRGAARRHSALMARQRDLSHQVAGEATLQRRVASAGYTGATMLGEVVAYGPRSAYDVVNSWLRSKPHRAIVLDCRFRQVGAGLVVGGDGRYWWTVDVGRR